MEGYNISFRFTANLFDFAIFDEFLEKNKIVVKKSSMGLHTDCATPHYHYHLWCENTFPFKAPPTQTFKNKYKSLEKVFKDNTNSLSVKVTELGQVSVSGESVENGENLSKNDIIRRFLNYPLKENSPIPEFCKGIDIKKSSLEANAEWKARIVWKQKQAERKAKDEAKKGRLYAHLDTFHKEKKFNITGLYGVVKTTLEFYKGQEDAPHPQYQVKAAEIYAYHHSIWSIEDIMERYVPKTNRQLAENLNSLGIDIC